jgi:hypothetical protein
MRLAAIDDGSVSRAEVLHGKARLFAGQACVPRRNAPIGNPEDQRRYAAVDDALGRSRCAASENHALDIGQRVARAACGAARAFKHYVELGAYDGGFGRGARLAAIGQGLLYETLSWLRCRHVCEG